MKKNSKRSNKLIFVLGITALLLLIFAGALLTGIFYLPEKFTCTHEEWQNGVCVTCGFACSHQNFEDGICTVCGYKCPHSTHDDYGICTFCGGDCLHLRHDPNDLYCLKCGKPVRHDFTNGACPICGKVALEETYCLDQFFWASPPESGNVIKLDYETRDYTIETEETVIKSMEVYLPYGYSEEKQYNVLILMHGSNGNEGYWFSRDHSYTYPSDNYVDAFSFPHLLDNMIYYRYCQPVIVVSPTFYLNDEERLRGDVPERDISQLRFELQKDIIPYIVDHFNTFAASSSYADLCAARDHFGFIGASYGATLTYSSVFCYDEDIISWFGAISGCQSDLSYICSYLHKNTAYDDKPVHYFYASAGDSEPAYQESVSGYELMTSISDRVSEENSEFTTIQNASHEDRVWDNGIYNCLLKFFR